MTPHFPRNDSLVLQPVYVHGIERIPYLLRYIVILATWLFWISALHWPISWAFGIETERRVCLLAEPAGSEK